MVSITVHGGASEIGGNKVLIENDDTRIFLDFGKNYSLERNFFDFPLLRPREEKHLLSLGALPRIPGLYKSDEEKPDVDGVFISHAHGDHWDYIRFVKDSIPIHSSYTTEAIIRAREESGRLGPSSEYYVANLTATRGVECFKRFNRLDEGKEKSIGSLKVKHYPVDHSIPGANSFLVETAEGYIAYSGDLRLHGREGELTETFIEEAQRHEPALLIIEGTNVVNAPMPCEGDVEESLLEIIEATPGLVMAGFYSTDCCRLNTFKFVAEKKERKLAISMKQAYLIHRVNSMSPKPISLIDDNISIYRKEKKGTYEYEKLILKEYKEKVVDSKIVEGNQSEYILVANLYDFNELVDLRPGPGSVYVHSMSEPFNEEMEIDYNKLVHWLDNFGIPSYQLHASGHARPHELKMMIKDINPKKVMLVHTEHPELFRRYIMDLEIETIIPDKGESYPL